MIALKDDILPSIPAMAEYIYGEATPTTIKRIRHQITIGRLPVTRRGKIFEGRKSWCDQAYSEPDPPKKNGKAG